MIQHNAPKPAADDQQKQVWIRPTVKRMSAGSAENGTTGIDDGGPLGSARS